MHFIDRLNDTMLKEELEEVQIGDQIQHLRVPSLVHLEQGLSFSFNVRENKVIRPRLRLLISLSSLIHPLTCAGSHWSYYLRQ